MLCLCFAGSVHCFVQHPCPTFLPLDALASMDSSSCTPTTGGGLFPLSNVYRQLALSNNNNNNTTTANSSSSGGNNNNNNNNNNSSSSSSSSTAMVPIPLIIVLHDNPTTSLPGSSPVASPSPVSVLLHDSDEAITRPHAVSLMVYPKDYGMNNNNNNSSGGVSNSTVPAKNSLSKSNASASHNNSSSALSAMLQVSLPPLLSPLPLLSLFYPFYHISLCVTTNELALFFCRHSMSPPFYHISPLMPALFFCVHRTTDGHGLTVDGISCLPTTPPPYLV